MDIKTLELTEAELLTVPQPNCRSTWKSVDGLRWCPVHLHDWELCEDHAIARAQLIKVACGIADWIKEFESTDDDLEHLFAYGGPSHCEYGCLNIIELLEEAFTAAGIPRPEEE